ncbi:hypothetical protein PG987_014650 [Apiospora arundinis]
MATHYLRIKNRSNHSQTFQCHGYNGDKNLTIGANQQANIAAKDGTSGAIIAVHDGVIGEQCEITKAGWQGNDTIDISNIVGAGGNMTCQQVGDPAGKFKGHETFMQACNKAWKGLSQQKKDQIKKWVTLDSKGNVKRIGPPKESQALEQFVRTFANGRTYIGVGSWAGGKGNPEDDKQSKAGKGSKDILIVYSDGNAAPDPSKPFTGQSIEGFAIASVGDEDNNDQAPLQEAEAAPQEEAEDAEGEAQLIEPPTNEEGKEEAATVDATAEDGTVEEQGFGIMAISQDAQKALNLHNNKRKGKGLKALVWDDQLAKNATAYAKVLAQKGKMEHSPGSSRPNQGENLAAGTGSLSLEKSAKMWLDEEKNYHGEVIPQGNFGSYGHYTQCMWKSTTKLGMGSAKGSNGWTYVVGRYSPPET